jgi:hypothetical protein
MTDNIIAFPKGRSAKKVSDKEESAALDASISRHPAGNSRPPVAPPVAENTVDHEYIGVKQILPAGMMTTNIEEIDYRIQRLDAVLSSVAQRTSQTDMARLTQFIKEALVTTAEITYFEGLAEGYTSYEEEEGED